MDSERWKQVDGLLQAALERGQRGAGPGLDEHRSGRTYDEEGGHGVCLTLEMQVERADFKL